MKKKTIKKLTLNKESILRLDQSKLRDAVGGYSLRCTATELCTESCAGAYTCLC